jgi:hypothetical protein
MFAIEFAVLFHGSSVPGLTMVNQARLAVFNIPSIPPDDPHRTTYSRRAAIDCPDMGIPFL